MQFISNCSTNCLYIYIYMAWSIFLSMPDRTETLSMPDRTLIPDIRQTFFSFLGWKQVCIDTCHEIIKFGNQIWKYNLGFQLVTQYLIPSKTYYNFLKIWSYNTQSSIILLQCTQFSHNQISCHCPHASGSVFFLKYIMTYPFLCIVREVMVRS